MGIFSKKSTLSPELLEQEIAGIPEWTSSSITATPKVTKVGRSGKRVTVCVDLSATGTTGRFDATELAGFCNEKAHVVETDNDWPQLMFLARAGKFSNDSMGGETMQEMPDGTVALLTAGEAMTAVATFTPSEITELGAWIHNLPGK